MSLPKRIEITEVGPRDGWQNHKAMIIPTEVKAKYVKKMIDAGADKIEITSFVNPKAVPQMANAKDLVALVQPYAKEKGCQTIGLALNKRGVDDAVAAGVDYVGFGISVSEEHNKRNSNRTVEASLEDFKNLRQQTEQAPMFLALMCVFGSPFGDEISLERVVKICEEAQKLGVHDFGLADTPGVSNPEHTRKVLRYLKNYLDFDHVSIHLHDTRGMGLANAYVAMEEGIYKLDASLGAMGGCPFVPGAKGNIATEDLIYMANDMGIETKYNLDAAVKIAIEMGEEIHADIVSSMANLCQKKN